MVVGEKCEVWGFVFTMGKILECFYCDGKGKQRESGSRGEAGGERL